MNEDVEYMCGRCGHVYVRRRLTMGFYLCDDRGGCGTVLTPLTALQEGDGLAAVAAAESLLKKIPPPHP